MRVLLVEDDPMIGSAVQAALKDASYAADWVKDGSAALTALALFVAYSQAAGISKIDIMDPKVIVGMFLGGMLPFIFCALSIEAVSKAAQAMIAEVRRQFKEITGIMEGTGKPEYENCVAISTHAALTQMIVPGCIAIATPILVG